MNQIEWCQVRLDITQEIQVTRRSKLPGDLALGNLPGDPALGNLPGDPALGNLPGDLLVCWEIIFKLKFNKFLCKVVLLISAIVAEVQYS